MIGTKHTRLYRYTSCTKNKILELPCNVDVIESVHIPISDAQTTNPTENYLDFDNVFAEKYVDA